MNELTLSLIYLGLPGILVVFLVAKLTGQRQTTATSQVLAVFVFSVASYGILAMCDVAANLYFNRVIRSDLADLILAKNRNVSLTLLCRAVVSATFLSYMLAYAHRHNLINRIGQKIHATNRYGDEDVWHYFHNVPNKQKNAGWVFVRDLKANLVYHCYISTWSDTGMDRELVLSDVTVFTNDTSDYLYKCAHLYLCRNKDDLMIEVPIENAEKLDEFKWKDPDKQKGSGEHDRQQQETTDRGHGEKGRRQREANKPKAGD